MPTYRSYPNSETSDASSNSDTSLVAELALEVPQYHSCPTPSTSKLVSDPRAARRLNRKFHHTNPYLLRSVKLNDVPGATLKLQSAMDGSNFFLKSTSQLPDPVTRKRIPCLADSSSLLPAEMQVMDTQSLSNVGPPISAGIISHSNLQFGSGVNLSASSIIRPVQTNCVQPLPGNCLQTVVIDGKTYEVHELIAVINRLKQDVRACTDRINQLEAELVQSRLLHTARDRDIHKLRSVLDQKIPTNVLSSGCVHTRKPDQLDEHSGTTVIGMPQTDTSPRHVGLDMISAQAIPPTELQRIKKQGVSGESQNQQRTSGLVHHQKDARSSKLIREAIENNDFLRHLDKVQVEEIVNCMYKKHINQGSYVIREGQTGDALYVVAEGVLEVSKNDQLLGRMDVGRAFGELALLYNCNRTASVRAVTKASAWTLDRWVFQQIMMSSCIHQHEQNIKFLQSVPALRSLSPAKMHKLGDVLETIYYGPDEYIIREGEIGETFFIIQSGKVRVTKSVNNSETTQEIRQLYKGDWFGEKALYTSEKRSANVIAMETGVQLLSLDRSNFIHLIGDLNEIKSKDYGDKEIGRKSPPHISIRPAVIPQEPQVERIRKEDLEPIAVLGVGGFGCVELVVWNKDRSRSFALKRMKKQHIVQTRQQEHICSERQILLEMRCPFICRLYCTYKDNKYVYMLMEACLGGELWTVLRNRGRFNDVVTRFVIACVLEAFTYLHTQGIIYRDLKPENLLLDEKGYVKLCDFGFAKHIGLGKKTWTFCGTPEYVAPEIILNKGHDYSADYWSLGILIFELLTGSPPFTGADPMKIYNVVLRGIDAIELPATYINRTTATLIRRLCAQNPAQRLGYGLGGIIDIKQNKYFQGFDWIGLHRGTLAAPIQPKIAGPADASNFDKYPEKVENPPDELSGWDVDF
ncbi:hypothetical protein EG68_00744 [Paragonimus skrjabini miyazakii]|uniref:cGMP-dependent protein kinase n=1 Tax=Paragonimus skrjabini miyazakii TaxID=59628 RepID=A0A8S9Z8X2_9TREM|nr:hypothetical protein EG68_00744 [Paragonimus skrjabini miyazakii]